MTLLTNQPDSIHDIRILFLGMKGIFSYNILNTLIDFNASICGVLTPAQKQETNVTNPGRELPVKHKQTNQLCYLAEMHKIPVTEINNFKDNNLKQEIEKLDPDLILIACFPFIVPEYIRILPKLGCFNLHPSLLPAYRGPMPLFWQFQQGEPKLGVTLHEVIDRLDAGDIILQESIDLPDGTSGIQANIKCSRLGGNLIINALKMFVSGTLEKRKQKESDSTYYSYPKDDDFIISTDWSAQRAFNFMVGTSHWNHVYEIVAGDQHFTVKAALSYSNYESLEKDYKVTDDELWIRFTPGVLHVQKLI